MITVGRNSCVCFSREELIIYNFLKPHIHVKEYFGFRSKIVGTKAVVNMKLLQATTCVGIVFSRGKQIGQYFGECFGKR